MSEPFNAELHEARVNDYYRRQANIRAFDKLADLAFKGEITREEAIASYEHNAEPVEPELDIIVEFEQPE